MAGNILKFLAGGLALVMLGVAIVYIVRNLRDRQDRRSPTSPYLNTR